MVKPNQLYISNTGSYHILVIAECVERYDRPIYLVKTNQPDIKDRPCLMLAGKSIKQSFTLVANNYQPK